LSLLVYIDYLEVAHYLLAKIGLLSVVERTGEYPIKGIIFVKLNQFVDELWGDDFGTGYSSFAYLAKLPIDVLKLDKVLVDGIEDCKEIQSMIAGLITMCHELGISVVAEGVELAGQVELLKRYKCDYIQGYFFSKALPKPEFEMLLLQQPFMI
tara:strand:- start:100 stop:561 length:462 start_codon:yes stop_codon:yes gene_type:complete